MTRVLVIPAFNEAERIVPVLERVRDVLPDYRVVVVDQIEIQ